MRQNIDSRCDERLGSEEEKHDDNALTDKGERKREKASRQRGEMWGMIRGLWRKREINMCSALPNGEIQFVRLKLLPRRFSDQPPACGRELASPPLPSSSRHPVVQTKGVPGDRVAGLDGSRCWMSNCEGSGEGGKGEGWRQISELNACPTVRQCCWSETDASSLAVLLQTNSSRMCVVSLSSPSHLCTGSCCLLALSD